MDHEYDTYDVIVIGAGPGGETITNRLMDTGKRVCLVERELIGGECAYWGCIPSKTLLRPLEARVQAAHTAGLSAPTLEWEAIRDYRDSMIRHFDDSDQVSHLRHQGVTVIKGEARITGPGTVEVGGQTVKAPDIVLATGSRAVRPPIEGLDEVPVWTNREATTLREIPGRVLLVGGGAVGVELGKFFARMGSQVTLVESSDRLLSQEEPRVSELVHQMLAADGVDVRLGARVLSARQDGEGAALEVSGAGTVRVDVVVLGAGRQPRTRGLGLETVGVQVDGRGFIEVDECCRAGEGVWAVGDVTGRGMLTHIAKYQARVAADCLVGQPRTASYTATPRVIFTSPEVAAVGVTGERATREGVDVVTSEVDLASAVARPATFSTSPSGWLGLVADRQERVLVGAWAVAPLAGEWIHGAAVAIRAGVGVDVLRDSIFQFPTFSEGYMQALDGLDM